MSAKGGKKGSRSGRNKDRYKKYRTELRKERNKEAKIVRHLGKHPNDEVASKALKSVY